MLSIASVPKTSYCFPTFKNHASESTADLIGVESQQVQHEKYHGQVSLAMTKIVFQVIFLIFQGIKRLLFDFPQGSAAFNQVFNIVFVNWNICYPAVFKRNFT